MREGRNEEVIEEVVAEDSDEGGEVDGRLLGREEEGRGIEEGVHFGG